MAEKKQNYLFKSLVICWRYLNMLTWDRVPGKRYSLPEACVFSPGALSLRFLGTVGRGERWDSLAGPSRLISTSSENMDEARSSLNCDSNTIAFATIQIGYYVLNHHKWAGLVPCTSNKGLLLASSQATSRFYLTAMEKISPHLQDKIWERLGDEARLLS